MKHLIIALFITSFIVIEVTAKTTQTAYRWRNDDGNEITASWKAPENVPIYFEGNNVVRLRVQENYFEPDDIVIPTEGDEDISQYDFDGEISLFYSLEGSDIWRKITDDATTNAFALYNSGNVGDLIPTTRQLMENLSYTWQPGVLYTTTSNHSQILSSDIYTEYEWSIQATSNATPGVYIFIKGWDAGGDLNQVKNAVELTFAPQPATMYYEVPMPAIPVKNWAVYVAVALMIAFVVIRFFR